MDKIEPMTKFGYEKLQAELHQLKQIERPAIVKAIEEAVAMGDLKENAEYHAAKERQSHIDDRLQELSTILMSAKIVDPSSLAHAKISFGSTVLLCDLESDEEISYTIVGSCESNPNLGLISFGSPVAKALLGKEEGDEVKIKLPNAVKEYEVLDVGYKEIIFECHD